MTEKFDFTEKHKKSLFILMGLGLVFILIGAFTVSTLDRIWASLLTTGWYFLVLGLAGTVIIAIKYLANAGWYSSFKRVPEAMSAYVPIGSLLLVVPLIIYLFIDHHSIYHWTHTEDVLEDDILRGKMGYLNVPFFAARAVLFVAIWIYFTMALRKNSLLEDEHNGLTYHKKNVRISVVFMILFALSFSFASWDWLMSLEPHWFSTIYGIYTFAGLLVGGIVVITMLIVYLKSKGHFQEVNENHFHDLGKFMFAFSIFWAYIWLSQYLLIWYANIPEATEYYVDRHKGGWKILFFTNLIVNFTIPLFFLMLNSAKRNYKQLLYVGLFILIGRYIDVYLLVYPGALGIDAGFGFMEVGFFLLFGGIYLFMVFKALASAAIQPKNHPYLEESYHHEVF